MSTKEGISCTTAELLHAMLIYKLQLNVWATLCESELLTKPSTPEGAFVSVDGIECTTTSHPVGYNVLVRVEFASDGLVELLVLVEDSAAVK